MPLQWRITSTIHYNVRIYNNVCIINLYNLGVIGPLNVQILELLASLFVTQKNLLSQNMDANLCASAVLFITRSMSIIRTAYRSMSTLEKKKQKRFTLDVNGYCYENSSVRLLFIQPHKFIMDPIEYFFMIGQYIYVVFIGLVIMYHLYNLDILRKNGNWNLKFL